MNNITNKLDRDALQSMTDTLLAARKNNLKEVLEIAHRLETVATLDDVVYINDSKSTNVNATLYSLECMTRPVVWIASVSDWEQDYDALTELVQAKVKAIVCVGDSGQDLAFDFGSFGKQTVLCDTLEAALAQVGEMTEPGDAVLFSPAHPSELCYDNYKERGSHFQKLVNHKPKS